jgi:hypothetical protein
VVGGDHTHDDSEVRWIRGISRGAAPCLVLLSEID